MSWFEQWIRRYEHRRWTVDNNRRVFPFEWGLEHIGGPRIAPGDAAAAAAAAAGLHSIANPAARAAQAVDPRAFLTEFARRTIASSDEWFATSPASDYRLEDGVLAFTSQVTSPWEVNNTVYASFFPARSCGPAVLVLPQWNAKPDQQVDLCRWLNTLGISALRMSLPYHDRRMVPGHERADQLVGPNLGLTIQANRQAVTDIRRCLYWLLQRGYSRLGIVGTSIGSSLAFITMCHEPLVRAGVFLHVSTYFGEVVRTGMTTMHVWEALRAKVTADELHDFWAPISPFPYISRLRGRPVKMLLVSGRYDPTFWWEFSSELLAELREQGIPHDPLVLPCGHYSLGEPPFSWLVGGRFGAFLMNALA
jgi:hypothetical protein